MQPRTCWNHLLDETVVFENPKLRPRLKIDRYAEQRKRKRKPPRTVWDQLLDETL